jgi:hypothetical protein
MEPGRSRDAGPLLLLLVLVTGTLVLAYAVLSRPMGNDEGIWLHVGRLWADHGAPPYVGAVENKTPGVFQLAAVVHRVRGPDPLSLRVAGVLHLLAGALLVGHVVRRLHDRTAGLAATLLVVFACAAPSVDGAYASATESFVVGWGTLSLALLLHGEGGTAGRARTFALAAGAALGVAIAFKQIALVGGGTLAAWVWLRGGEGRVARIALAGAGAVAGTLVASLPVLVASGLPAYVDGAWMILLDAGTRPDDDGLRVRLVNLIVAWDAPLTWLVAGTVACALLQRRIAGGAVAWACLAAWLVFDGLGAHAAGRYYGHQWKTWIPALAAATGVALSIAATSAVPSVAEARRAAGVLLVAALLAFPWRLPADAAKRVNRRAGETDRALAAWIAERTTPEDRVFLVSPHMNAVLAQSGRRTPSRYVNTLFLGRPGAREELAAAFRATPPALVLVSDRFPGADALVASLPLEGYVLAEGAPFGGRVLRRR